MQRIFKYAINAAAAMLLAIGLTSCDSMLFSDEGDCDPHYYLQFVFDRNMFYNDKFQIGADAFAAQVGSVDVYLFDAETGNFVAHFSDASDHLREQGYRLSIDVEPGEYDIVAWCGLANNDDHFTIPENVSHISELKCRMARDIDENQVIYSNKCLNTLFHGKIFHAFPDVEGEHYATIYLTKDTNYIQLAMQHKSGPLDAEQFDITMEDANGYLNYDNSLLDDASIQYRPWSLRGGVVDMGDDTRAGDDDDYEGKDNGTGFLVAELATSRLMADRNPVINVTDKETDKVVFSLPLVKYLLMMKSDRYSKMDGQEYLDREYEYDIMVFLEDREGWLAAEIVINGWHIVDNGNVGL